MVVRLDDWIGGSPIPGERGEPGRHGTQQACVRSGRTRAAGGEQGQLFFQFHLPRDVGEHAEPAAGAVRHRSADRAAGDPAPALAEPAQAEAGLEGVAGVYGGQPLGAHTHAVALVHACVPGGHARFHRAAFRLLRDGADVGEGAGGIADPQHVGPQFHDGAVGRFAGAQLFLDALAVGDVDADHGDADGLGRFIGHP